MCGYSFVTESQTASRRTTDAKRAAFLDGIHRRLPYADACAAAGISRRLPYHWKATDERFAVMWAEASEAAAHLVSQRQVADWRTELAQQERELAELEAALVEAAAPAAAGDEAAQQRQADLRARHQRAQEAVGALRTVILSGEQHLQRQAAEKAERERLAAAAEDERLAEQQRAAAQEVDAALATLEQAVQRFTDAAIARQSAQRRATGSRRPVVADRQVMQAMFAGAPKFAVLIGADRKLASHPRALGDLV